MIRENRERLEWYENGNWSCMKVMLENEQQLRNVYLRFIEKLYLLRVEILILKYYEKMKNGVSS